MPSTAQSFSQARGGESARVMVFEQDPERSGELIAALSALGCEVTKAEPSMWTGEGASLRDHVNLVVVGSGLYTSSAWEGSLVTAVAEAGIPVLVVVEESKDAQALVDRLGEADDWISRPALDHEFPVRVGRLLRRGAERGRAVAPARAASTLPTDSQFFALVVHDLRTPLNVIGLSLRMINQAVPKGDPDLEEDLRFVDENYRQIERMLAQLSDFYRLFENDGSLSPTPFSPTRMIDELLEARAIKAGMRNGPVLVDVRSTCPKEVELDQGRARQAIQYALANASASSNGAPIRLSLHGGPERLIIEVSIDKPPPASVQSVALSSQSFERLCGFAAERRGMDLAIAAKISEMFGGTARLDVIENQGTSVVLDWPARLKSN